MERKFSLELFVRIYEDNDGRYIQIGPDADGLDLVEIRSIESDSKEVARITMPPAQAHLMIAAIQKVLAGLPAGAK